MIRSSVLLKLGISLIIVVLQTSNGQVKNSLSLADRVQHLTDMSDKRAVLRFNGQQFKEYIRNGPRNYSSVVMFTALSPERGCSICQAANEEYVIVANSFRYSQARSNKLFFMMVDFDDGSDAFRILKLNTAPVFMHFPAKGKSKGSDNLDVSSKGFAASAIAKWIEERTDVHIHIYRPPNYSGAIAYLVLASLIATFLYIRRDNLEFLYNKYIWGIAAVGFCFVMISGQMWNHIRSPPFMHRTQNGPSYIHGSSQGQFVLETYIVLALNAAISLGMVFLAEAATRKNNVRVRRIVAIVGLALVAFFFSVILSIFKSKAHGYPYSFLIK